MANSTLKVPKSKAAPQNKRSQPFAYASYHGAKRIAQRTSMDILELMLMLDNDVCINIGQVAGSHRRHLLFYSPKDKFYYVAIQNALNGKVITILPPAYHKNSAWKITEEQYQQAKLCYEMYTDFKRIHNIWVQALYVDKDLGLKRKTLFNVSVEYDIDDFQQSIDKLLKEPDTFRRIDASIQKKRIFQGSIYAISFRHKKDMTLFRRITLRPNLDAEYRMIAHNRQLQHMAMVLAYYLKGGLALSLPSSMRLPQLPLLKMQANEENNQNVK